MLAKRQVFSVSPLSTLSRIIRLYAMDSSSFFFAPLHLVSTRNRQQTEEEEGAAPESDDKVVDAVLGEGLPGADVLQLRVHRAQPVHRPVRLHHPLLQLQNINPPLSHAPFRGKGGGGAGPAGGTE